MPLIPALLLLILSCGGGVVQREIELRFSGVGAVDAPYFTGVELRISAEDTGPYLFSKSGIFFPGDVVTFEVLIPEGPERHFEALVYDNLGNPVYYGAKTADAGRKSRIVIELHPSEAVISSYIRFYDGGRPASTDLFIVNEDLSMSYGPFRTSGGTLKTYLTGSYIAYRDGERSLRYSYAYASEEVDLYLESRRSYTVRLPLVKRPLYLTGSYEGPVYDGGVIEVSSERILSDDTVVLSGVGEGIHIFIGKPTAGVIGTWHSTCVTLKETDCLPLRLSFAGIMPERYEIYGVFRGIEFLAGSGEYFWMNPGITYRIRLYGRSSDQNCSYSWMVEGQLPENFSGSASIVISTIFLGVPGGVTGYFRVYGEGLETEGFCNGAKVVQFVTLGNIPPETFFEVERAGRRLGVLISSPLVVFPYIDIKKVVLKPEGNSLYFKFNREGDLADCELTLHGSNYRIHVDRIPPWRSYLRIRDLLGEGFGKAFEESPAGESTVYSLKCYTPQRDAYVLVGPFENIGLGEEPF